MVMATGMDMTGMMEPIIILVTDMDTAMRLVMRVTPMQSCVII